MYEKAALPSRSVESARKTASEEVRSYMEFIGLDVHRHYSVAARMEASGTLIERRRLHNDELVGFVQSLTERPKVAFEASGSWYHIYELLEPWVEELVLSHPLKTRIIAETKIKTDKVDATALADLLRIDYLPRSYIAPAPVRELRELLRLRMSLVRLRTTARNKVHAVLIKRGLTPPVKNVFGKRGRAWLAALALPAAYGLAIASYLEVIDLLAELINRLNAQIHARAASSQEAVWLDSIPGIGPFTALLILAEVGDIWRFPDAAHLCSYAGLVPSVYSSGGRTRYGPLTKQGSAYLRWVMVQAANSASRVRGPLKDRYDRLRQKKPHPTAIVDLARFMLGCVYAMLTERRAFRVHPRGS
jgi:transposase